MKTQDGCRTREEKASLSLAGWLFMLNVMWLVLNTRKDSGVAPFPLLA